MGRLARVRKLYRERPRPFRALKRWARKPKGARRKESRYRTLQKWARKRKAAGAGRKLWERRRRAFRRKKRYYRKRRKARERQKDGEGVVIFDGERVPAWIADILKRARATGLWWGEVISGVRTTAESVGLCYEICGAASCPGRCAGAASNHNADEPVVDGEGAVDVTDHVGLIRAIAAIGESHRLKNTIGPSDPNHMSRSGR